MSIILNGTTGITTPDVDSTIINGLTVGRGAGAVATNTAVGASALASNTSGSYGVAVGRNALSANTTGTENQAFGHTSLYSNTTGNYNNAFGRGAMYNNTTGSNNVAIGTQALVLNTTASNNTAVGYQAGYTNQTGTQNLFLGYGAGYTNNSNYNVFIGMETGRFSTGTLNCFVGYNSGYNMTTGSKNTIIGAYAGTNGGLNIAEANNYIVLSDGDGNPRYYSNPTNVFIGETGSFVNGSYNRGTGTQYYIDFRVGWTSAASPGTQTGYISTNGTTTSYVTSSDYRLKNTIAPMTGALAKVALLKPCTYKWNVDGSNSQGFIAHELAEVVPECVTGEKDAVDADGNPKYQGIDVSFLVATLTAAIQELKAEFDAYKATHP